MSAIRERRFVAYYRMGEFSLSEQVRCVEAYVHEAGGHIIKAYRDDETSVLTKRPGFGRALAHAKRHGASLIIASVHRLSRDLPFLRSLERSQVDFLACDLPQANTATLHVLLALAEYEERMAVATAAVKGSGLDAAARARGSRRAGEVRKAQADEAYRELTPMIQELRAAGFTLQEIADRLDAAGYRTRRGKTWNAMQVSRVLKRAKRGV
jgi:DNA invertase Pin-like site-specific DNA recombinase